MVWCLSWGLLDLGSRCIAHRLQQSPAGLCAAAAERCAQDKPDS